MAGKRSKASDATSDAETWQRAQAWATWERIAAGDAREVPLARLEAFAERAIRTVARSGRRQRRA